MRSYRRSVMAISNKPFPKATNPYQPGKPVPEPPKSTPVELTGIPPKPMAPNEPDDVASMDDTQPGNEEPHPEHVAGQKAVEHYEAKTKAEMEAGRKAVARHPHRFK